MTESILQTMMSILYLGEKSVFMREFSGVLFNCLEKMQIEAACIATWSSIYASFDSIYKGKWE